MVKFSSMKWPIETFWGHKSNLKLLANKLCQTLNAQNKSQSRMVLGRDIFIWFNGNWLACEQISELHKRMPIASQMASKRQFTGRVCYLHVWITRDQYCFRNYINTQTYIHNSIVCTTKWYLSILLYRSTDKN